MIAICDHNSAENVAATRQAGEKVDLAVIGGMEITSREEVHVLGLFGRDGQLSAIQDVVYEQLFGFNDADIFGEQLVMDANDNIVRSNGRLLIGATDMTLEQVVQTVHKFGGVAIASHVARPSYSVISQLGFIPPSLALDAAEVCDQPPPALPEGLPIVRSSDAHSLDRIGARCTRFLVAKPTASEIGMALAGAGGRKILN